MKFIAFDKRVRMYDCNDGFMYLSLHSLRPCFILPLCCSECTHEGFICLLGECRLLSLCKAAFYLRFPRSEICIVWNWYANATFLLISFGMVHLSVSFYLSSTCLFIFKMSFYVYNIKSEFLTSDISVCVFHLFWYYWWLKWWLQLG